MLAARWFCLGVFFSSVVQAMYPSHQHAERALQGDMRQSQEAENLAHLPFINFGTLLDHYLKRRIFLQPHSKFIETVNKFLRERNLTPSSYVDVSSLETLAAHFLRLGLPYISMHEIAHAEVMPLYLGNESFSGLPPLRQLTNHPLGFKLPTLVHRSSGTFAFYFTLTQDGRIIINDYLDKQLVPHYFEKFEPLFYLVYIDKIRRYLHQVRVMSDNVVAPLFLGKDLIMSVAFNENLGCTLLQFDSGLLHSVEFPLYELQLRMILPFSEHPLTGEDKTKPIRRPEDRSHDVIFPASPSFILRHRFWKSLEGESATAASTPIDTIDHFANPLLRMAYALQNTNKGNVPSAADFYDSRSIERFEKNFRKDAGKTSFNNILALYRNQHALLTFPMRRSSQPGGPNEYAAICDFASLTENKLFVGPLCIVTPRKLVGLRPQDRFLTLCAGHYPIGTFAALIFFEPRSDLSRTYPLKSMYVCTPRGWVDVSGEMNPDSNPVVACNELRSSNIGL